MIFFLFLFSIRLFADSADSSIRICDIPSPAGYERFRYPEGSFASWITSIPLKKGRIFSGNRLKSIQKSHTHLIDIDQGTGQLQCGTGGLYRLRAEFLYQKKDYLRISYRNSNGLISNYQWWLLGFRENTSCTGFIRDEAWARNDLKIHFSSFLKNYLAAKNREELDIDAEMTGFDDLIPGDFITGKSFSAPAVMLADKAVNRFTGDVIYLLIMSSTPNQDIHITADENNSELSPWYHLNRKLLSVPEYRFINPVFLRFIEY